jgi:CHAT domain-containing protein
MDLSEILQELSKPSRLGDMPRHIELCQRALDLVSLENAQLWAMLKVELGNSLFQSPLGDRAENIEKAIQHYSLALNVFKLDHFPEQWAMTQNNLDNSYRDRIRGDRAENIELAIQHYNLALKIFKLEHFPEKWAMTQNNLAAAYNDRIRDDRAENIEKAIKHYKLALKIFKLEDFPEPWAGTQSNLATAYNDRFRGDRAENIEQAIQYCSLALKVYKQEDFPEQWAMTQNNLGNSYRDRIRGDRAENIEQAIQHYDLALKVRTAEDFPEKWAGTQNNLGNAYRDRIHGDRAKNIEQAIQHYKLALKIFKQEDFPEQWATTLSNLAVAYNDRIRGDRAENIEQAIQHYFLAMKIRTTETFPEQWAVTQNNLANAYRDRIHGERAENIEQAIKHYNLALKVRTMETFPEQWAMTQNNLANAYNDRIHGDRAENIEQAIVHYNHALKVYTQKNFPNYCRGTAYWLGNLYLEGHRFSDAGKAYSMGMDATEELYGAAIFHSSREAELAETRDLYRRAGYALLKSGDTMKAVEALERGRARGLGLSLARDRADMEKVREKDPQAYKDYWQTILDLQNLESQERAGVSAEGKASPSLRDLMMQAKTRLSEVLDRIRRIQGYESFLKEPSWREIADAVIVGHPLIYLAAAPAGGVALIVHRLSEYQDATVELVNLDRFSEQRLQELLKIWFDAYGGWQESLKNSKISAEDFIRAKKHWFDAIEMVTGQLWQEVMGPVFGRLQSLDAQQAFLIPTGMLSLLPLHAAWQEKDGRKRYLLEMMPVSYIPSARSLAHVRRIAYAAGSENLLAVDEPRTIKPAPLPNSHAEVTTIRSHFQNPQILEHEKATRRAVLQALPSAQVAHFSCHGGANWSDPEQSGLLMANDEILTVKDLFELHLDGARMATLSACETGVPGTKLPDEVVSLPSAFIRAGFAGAIGSLWTVPDRSTAQLMTSFYQLWRQKPGINPVQALAEAQKELREKEKFRHPFYWAAFYMSGV